MSESFFLPCEYYNEHNNHLFPKGCELLAQQAKYIQYDFQYEKYTIQIIIPNNIPVISNIGKFLNYSMKILYQAKLIPSQGSNYLDGMFLTYSNEIKTEPHYYSTELEAVSFEYIISFYPIRQRCYPEKDK